VIDKEGNETDKAVAWEKAFIQLVKVCFLSQSSDCVYGVWNRHVSPFSDNMFTEMFFMVVKIC
jgi:hypothetical protein